MWESRERFPRSEGRVGNSFIVSHAFLGPAFPRPIQLRSDHSRGGLHHGFFPVLFEPDWADVVQRRVQPSLVIPEEPGDGCILGLSDRCEALPMQPLHLQ
jgi:hypothetical protein